MPNNDVSYQAIPFQCFTVDRAHCLLTSPLLDTVIPVVNAVPSALALCARPGTLQEHEEMVTRRLGSSSTEVEFVRAALESLVKAGLLRQVQRPSPARAATGERPVAVVGVVTDGEAEHLRRCLESYAAVGQRCSRPLRFVVSDAGRASTADANKALVARLAREHALHITYIGPAERMLLAEAVIARGADPAIARRTLSEWPDLTSARNALLLATAGHRVLAVDDRTVCAVWSRPAGAELRLGGHCDPRAYECFERREDALRLGVSTADPFVVHGCALGETLQSLSEQCGPPDVEHACAHNFTLLTPALEVPSVRVTMSGIAGDSDHLSPYPILVRLDVTGPGLTLTDDACERLLVYRETRRISDGYVLTHDSACELYCSGLDNRELLPPFLAEGHAGVDAFGSIVSRLWPGALFAQVPVGVALDTDRQPFYDADALPAVLRVHAGEIVGAAVAKAALSPFMASPDERLVSIGHHVRMFADLPHGKWRDTLRAALVERRAETLKRIDHLEDSATLSGAARGALKRYRLGILSSLESPTFMLPLGSPSESVDDALRMAHVAMSRWALLLTEWPTMWAAAMAASIAEIPEEERCSGGVLRRTQT